MQNVLPWIRRSFEDSAYTLRTTRGVIRCALLLSMQVVLSLITGIYLMPSVKISFSYLALVATGSMFGPVPAMINGALCDLLVFLIKPSGAYFPGFTLSGLVSGFIYGLVFFRRDVRIRHVLLAKGLNDVLVNLMMNTLWLSILYGKGFFALFPARVLKNVLQYPVDALLILPVIALCRRINKPVTEGLRK